jgi:hypothetical protein
MYPGLIAEYLKENFPHAAEIECEFSEEIDQELKDSMRYLVFKLSSHSSGCTQEQIKDLLGRLGVERLNDLVNKELVLKKGERYFSAVKRRDLAPEQFKEKFQFMSQFIEVEDQPGQSKLQNVFSIYSSSLNKDACLKVVKVQKKSLKKIREIMISEASQGELPVFALSAIDTIDY